MIDAALRGWVYMMMAIGVLTFTLATIGIGSIIRASITLVLAAISYGLTEKKS